MAIGRILRVRANLGLARGSPLVFLSQCTGICAGIADNPTIFVDPSPGVLVLQEQIQDATVAQQNVARLRGGSAVRDARFRVLHSSMESELCYVQSLCDAAPPEVALTIISAASMNVDGYRGHQKALLSVKNALPSGTVLLEANGRLLDDTQRAKIFNWRCTMNGQTFSALPSSETGKTSISGLTPLTRVGFQVSILVHKQPPGPWSQTVSILVL
jgi:hypothetical protein